MRLTPQRIAGAFVGCSLFAIGFLPLFGGPGYEQSLASGLIVPSAAAIATASELSDPSEPALLPVDCVLRGVQSGLLLAGVAFLTALAQSLRVGMCDFVGGLVSFALTALAGSVLGGVWGAVVGEVARGRKRRRLIAALLGVGLPLATALVSVWRFYSSPMIFAFDPFVGYFSGTLYDTVIDAGDALLTYRLGSLASLLFVILFATVLTRDATHALRLVPLGRGSRPAGARLRLGASLAFLAASLLVTLNGPALGHWQTSETIAKELGGFTQGVRCDVVHPDTLLPRESALLAKDCDEQLAQVEKTLGAKGPARIRAFFFRDGGEKKRLMGAESTLIAKPWREEVYVQLSVYPHPVLGHELAHVVAGSFGRGPFRIAGSLGGIWPDPGLIEGTAVAASPDDDELSDAQWAHAMLDNGAMPPIRELFSVGFLNVAASKSYTLAGAFVRFVLDTYGSGAVRAWYGGASLPALTGKSWETLDGDFRAAVKATPLEGEALSFAKARFERAAVFGRTCPHVVDALRRKADGCREAHEVAKATATYEEVLLRDPHDWGARYGLGLVNMRYGDRSLGDHELTAMATSDETPRTWRDRAKDALADRAALDGDLEGAKKSYDALAEKSLEEDFARNEEVKAIAVSDQAARVALFTLLVGEPRRPPDVVIGMERVGEWEDKTKSALAAYIVGRNFAVRGWYEAALPYLDDAVNAGVLAGVTTPRVAREALRLRAVASCALGDAAGVSRAREAVSRRDGPFSSSPGRSSAVLRMLDRCTTTPSPEARP
jgi:hypothetical protein